VTRCNSKHASQIAISPWLIPAPPYVPARRGRSERRAR
jgi:hypothetical protein